MDISLEDDITRNWKSQNKNFLLKQNHQPVCSICNERVGMNIICCSECHCNSHYKCLLLPSYQLYNFIKRKRKYTWANCAPVDLSDITPWSADIDINELKDSLNKIEDINTLLREENKKLREENTIIKNSNKVDKASKTNKINELETQVKNLQKSLTEANRKNAEKIKEIQKLKRQTYCVRNVHTVSESGRMTEDNIDFRAENNSNLNWELQSFP